MIKNDVDLNSDAWRDFVFEGRNQQYGGYYLRKTSSKRHLFALIIVLAVSVLFILILPEIHFNVKLQSDEYELKSIELSNLIDLEESINTPQPKPEEKPLLEEIAKFTPPVIVEDDNTEEIRKELQETPVVKDSIDSASLLSGNTLLHKEIIELNMAEESDTTAKRFINDKTEYYNEKSDLLRYIYQNIHYPPAALKQRINGRVVCSFIINEDGSISDITLVQGVYSFLDDEVLRVIRSMSTWKPVMKDGKPVKTKCIVPVVFK